MISTHNQNKIENRSQYVDYAMDLEKEPVEIAKGIYWVGYSITSGELNCNPYLVIEGDEAVLIDGGSRDEFSKVMLKILRTGIVPAQIKRLIYHHYDPDLCGSLPQFEAIINSDSLKIISHEENNLFINYYSRRTEKIDFRDLDNHYDFATGRRLEFYPTPFCHQPGSFVTYDKLTKTLFTSDLFGSYDENWSLFLKLNKECNECLDTNKCPNNVPKCPIDSIKKFHQKVMASNLAVEYTMNLLESLDIECIAPQHGSVIPRKEDVQTIIKHLKRVKNVGIEYFLYGEG